MKRSHGFCGCEMSSRRHKRRFKDVVLIILKDVVLIILTGEHRTEGVLLRHWWELESAIQCPALHR